MKTNYQIDQTNEMQIENPEYWMTLIQQEKWFTDILLICVYVMLTYIKSMVFVSI